MIQKLIWNIDLVAFGAPAAVATGKMIGLFLRTWVGNAGCQCARTNWALPAFGASHSTQHGLTWRHVFEAVWAIIRVHIFWEVLPWHDSGAAIAKVQGRQWEYFGFAPSKCCVFVMTPSHEKHLKGRRRLPLQVARIEIHGTATGHIQSPCCKVVPKWSWLANIFQDCHKNCATLVAQKVGDLPTITKKTAYSIAPTWKQKNLTGWPTKS